MDGKDFLTCKSCTTTFKVTGNVPVLLQKELSDPSAETRDTNILRKRYKAQHFSVISSDYIGSLKIAWDNKTPHGRKMYAIMEKALANQSVNFILDIGEPSRGYIKKVSHADSCVVLDISTPWLTSIVATSEWRHAVAGDCEELTFKSYSFERILVNGVLLHIFRQRLALQKIGRILKPGGTAVIIEPAKWSVALLYYILRRGAFAFLGVRGLKKFLRYYGSPYESYLAPRLINKTFRVDEYDVRIEKSTPVRLPYVVGEGAERFKSIYLKIFSSLEGTDLTSWFGSYLMATIHNR